MDERTRLLILLIPTAVTVLVGCASTDSQAQLGQPLQIADVNRAEAMDAAEVVLDEMHFAVTKKDPNSGVVRTDPLSGAQFFEFWRVDNATIGDALEANLHTIRRSVELSFGRTDDQLTVQCVVRVQRLSLPEKDIPSVSHAYRIYSQSTRETQRLRLYPDLMKNLHWIDLGQDPALAQQILTQISRQIVKTQKDRAT